MPIHMLDDVVCTAISNPDFDPLKALMKISAKRLRRSVEVGMSPEMLRLLADAIRTRIAADPPDKAEWEALLQSLPGA